MDEAGHAGINYLDDEQPFHVTAGILVAQSCPPYYLYSSSGPCNGTVTPDPDGTKGGGSASGHVACGADAMSMGLAFLLVLAFGAMRRHTRRVA